MASGNPVYSDAAASAAAADGAGGDEILRQMTSSNHSYLSV